MARVYVGNLDPKVNEPDIENEFRTFGVIRSVWVAKRPPGYAFDDKHDAQDAIRELDGVWMHLPSFDDKGYGSPPPKWKGKCVVVANFTGCNKKLIGAQYSHISTNPDEKLSPADLEGHGTHTASTAAGILVKNANVFGIGNGTVRGGVDSARIAAYKVCWGGSCSEMDLLAGFDMVISDGVDVISVSIGGTLRQLFEDAIAIGAFHAMKNGIFVACSAGNEGPHQRHSHRFHRGKIINVIPPSPSPLPGHAVALEIQATIPSTPEKPSKVAMWKGAMGAYFVNPICYFPVKIIGYWAFGQDVTDNVLVALQKPSWLIAAANLMVVVHVLGSYQITY